MLGALELFCAYAYALLNDLSDRNVQYISQFLCSFVTGPLVRPNDWFNLGEIVVRRLMSYHLVPFQSGLDLVRGLVIRSFLARRLGEVFSSSLQSFKNFSRIVQSFFLSWSGFDHIGICLESGMSASSALLASGS